MNMWDNKSSSAVTTQRKPYIDSQPKTSLPTKSFDSGWETHAEVGKAGLLGAPACYRWQGLTELWPKPCEIFDGWLLRVFQLLLVEIRVAHPNAWPLGMRDQDRGWESHQSEFRHKCLKAQREAWKPVPTSVNCLALKDSHTTRSSYAVAKKKPAKATAKAMAAMVLHWQG